MLSFADTVCRAHSNMGPTRDASLNTCILKNGHLDMMINVKTGEWIGMVLYSPIRSLVGVHDEGLVVLKPLLPAEEALSVGLGC